MATKAFSCGTRLTFRWFKFSEPRLSIQRRDSLRLDVTHQSWTHLTCTGVQYLYPDRLTDRCIYSRFRQHVSHSNDSCDRRRHGFYRCRYFHLWSLNGCSLAHQRTHYSTAHNSHRHVQWATHAWCTFTEYKPHFRSIDSYLFFTFQCYSCVMSLYSCLWHIAWRHAELLQISFIMTSIVIGLFVNSVERVCGFKLLRLYISNDMSWNLHVDYICARTDARLHYLKRLKPAGLPTDRLAIPPSSDQFLNIAHLFGTTAWGSIKQKRVRRLRRSTVHIIYPVTMSMPYWVALQYAELPSLSDRRDTFCGDFFPQIA